jgi:hypothetical protein
MQDYESYKKQQAEEAKDALDLRFTPEEQKILLQFLSHNIPGGAQYCPPLAYSLLEKHRDLITRAFLWAQAGFPD